MYLKGYKWLLPQNYQVKNAYWTKHIKPFLKKTKIKWKDVTALNTCTKIKRGFPWLFQKILLMICQTYAMRKKKKHFLLWILLLQRKCSTNPGFLSLLSTTVNLHIPTTYNLAHPSKDRSKFVTHPRHIVHWKISKQIKCKCKKF